MMMNKRIFAFISYSSKDKKVAEDIQDRLEKYVYPHEDVLAANRPYDSVYVRPIFRDMTDLSARSEDYWDELREYISTAKRLIVICSHNSAQSDAVAREIDIFLDTHQNNLNLITPVFIDKIEPGMPVAINKIVAQRNCPIYITERTKEGHMGRKYCFYRLLEHLLQVDFYKLYNRYEEYKKKKRRIRISIFSLIAALGLITAVTGWISAVRIATAEKEKTKIAEALTIFERKTFPYSLVVGYVNNFLKPTLDVLNNTCNEPHIIIYMPYSYEELDITQNSLQLDSVFALYDNFQCFELLEINILERKRTVSLVTAKCKDKHINLFVDHAHTVLAFKSVIDYKCDSTKNPLKIKPSKESRDLMTRQYTDEFIQSTMEAIPQYASQIHFVKSKEDLRKTIEKLTRDKYGQ